MTKHIKDLYKGLDDLSFVNKDEYEYYCDACGWKGDQASYEPIQNEVDDEGYPIGEYSYVEQCPECGYLLNY